MQPYLFPYISYFKLINAVDKFVEYRPRLKRKDLNQYKNIEDIDMAIHTDIIMPRIAKSKKERGEDPQTAMFTERKSIS